MGGGGWVGRFLSILCLREWWGVKEVPLLIVSWRMLGVREVPLLTERMGLGYGSSTPYRENGGRLGKFHSLLREWRGVREVPLLTERMTVG